MKKTNLIVTATLLAMSVWIGFEIDPDRDWIAWLFIVIIPFVIIALAAILNLKSSKKGDNNEH